MSRCASHSSIGREKNEMIHKPTLVGEILGSNLELETSSRILRILSCLLSAHFRVSAASVKRLTLRRESVFIVSTCSVENSDTV